MSCRTAAREVFSLTRAAKRPRLDNFLPSRRKHTLAPLPYSLEEGLPEFLAPKTLQTLAIDYQQGLLDRVNDLTRGDMLENESLAETVVRTASDRTRALAFNYASQALNNAFFLSRLRPGGGMADQASRFSAQIAKDFGGSTAFQHSFSSAALGLFGSGWLWLVADGTCRLGLVGTYGPGTMLAQNQERRGEYEDILQAMAERKPEDESAQSPAAARPDSSSSGYQHRAFSTSAVASALSGFGARSTDPMGNPSALYPLLCMSIHEHAWLADYGIWGKEAYVTRFWNAVDWARIEQDFAKLQQLSGI